MTSAVQFGGALAAFLRRDLLLELSYRFALVLHYLGLIAHVLTFFYVARLVGPSPWLAPYGGDYFTFVLLGLAFSGFLGFGLSGFSSALRVEQYYGTLEPLLTTPTPPWQVAILATTSGYVATLIETIVYFLAAFALGVRFPNASWGTALVVAALTASAFSAIGVLAASFILVFKRGDPINWMIGTLSQFLGGVYFPVTVLPIWLQYVAKALPVTHGLEALRKALVHGASIGDVKWPLLALAGFSLVGWPLAVMAFKVGLDAARKRGSLGHY